jgi:hypothetical protein
LWPAAFPPEIRRFASPQNGLAVDPGSDRRSIVFMTIIM